MIRHLRQKTRVDGGGNITFHGPYKFIYVSKHLSFLGIHHHKKFRDLTSNDTCLFPPVVSAAMLGLVLKHCRIN